MRRTPLGLLHAVKLFFRIFEPTVLILRKLLDRGVCFGVARASLPAGLLALLGALGRSPGQRARRSGWLGARRSWSAPCCPGERCPPIVCPHCDRPSTLVRDSPDGQALVLVRVPEPGPLDGLLQRGPLHHILVAGWLWPVPLSGLVAPLRRTRGFGDVGFSYYNFRDRRMLKRSASGPCTRGTRAADREEPFEFREFSDP